MKSSQAGAVTRWSWPGCSTIYRGAHIVRHSGGTNGPQVESLKDLGALD